jgi:hypothetical protein
MGVAPYWVILFATCFVMLWLAFVMSHSILTNTAFSFMLRRNLIAWLPCRCDQ